MSREGRLGSSGLGIWARTRAGVPARARGSLAAPPATEKRVHAAQHSARMPRHVPTPSRRPRPPSPQALNPAEGSVLPTRIEVRLGRNEVLPGRLWAGGRPRALIAVVHGL